MNSSSFGIPSMVDNSIDFGARFCQPPRSSSSSSIHGYSSSTPLKHSCKGDQCNSSCTSSLNLFHQIGSRSSNGSECLQSASPGYNYDDMLLSRVRGHSYGSLQASTSTAMPINQQYNSSAEESCSSSFSLYNRSLERSGSYDKDHSSLSHSGNYSDRGFGTGESLPRLSGMRAIRAAHRNQASTVKPLVSAYGEDFDNFCDRFGGSGSTGRGSRSPSPADSTESSGVSNVTDSCLTSWISNLNLGTSVTASNRLPLSIKDSHLSSAPIPPCNVSSITSSRITTTRDNGSSVPLMSTFFGDRRWQSPKFCCTPYDGTNGDVVERAAKLHRNAASFSEAKCTWSGQLPPRIHKNPTYSCKVFLGGIQWDITEDGLIEAFASFGQIKVQWPARDGRATVNNPLQKAGYVYIIFENDKQVKNLLSACTHDFSNGGKWYWNISSRRMRSKEVQVIPWAVADSNFVLRCPSQRLDTTKTVFVGALHGMLTAEGLAHIMNDLFGGVMYVGLDTDRHKYPMGSSRVTFNNTKSYMKAVSAGFIDIKCPRFSKKIQVDPYMEIATCSACSMQQASIFCRDVQCFRYFCKTCWQWMHSVEPMTQHRPLMRVRRE